MTVLVGYGLAWPKANGRKPVGRDAALAGEETAHSGGALAREPLVLLERPVGAGVPLDRQPLDVLAALQHTGHSAQRLLGGVAEGVRAASEQVSWSVIWISAITLKRMCHLEPPSPPPPRAAAAAAATGAQSRDGDTPLVDEPLDDALGTLRRQLDAPRGLDAHLDRRAG